MKRFWHGFKVGDKVKWTCGNTTERGVITQIVTKMSPETGPFMLPGDFIVKSHGDNYGVCVDYHLCSKDIANG